MPEIYDINFNQQAIDLLPPDKRDTQAVTLLQALLKPLQWCRDFILGNYRTGATASAYSPGAYNKYDRVLFQKSVYEALVNTSNDPSNTTDWMLVQKNFIGVSERVLYNAQKIVLEYALNKNFGGVFRQPITGLNSDIYINNLPAVLDGFRIGQTETDASSVGQNISSDSIGGTYPFIQITNFVINVPAALFALTNEKAIRNFVNLYIPVSLTYTIQTY